MKITNMTVNHMVNPIGFHMEDVKFYWLVEESSAKSVASSRVRVAKDAEMKELVYDSEAQKKDFSGCSVKCDWEPCTRYYWQVNVTDTKGETAVSEIAYFETAKDEKEWEAQWIGSTLEGNGIVYQDFMIEPGKKIQQARIYMTGVGLYEVYLNGKKVGEEYLTPNFNDYDNFIQFQTYEAEEYLTEGENHLEIWLGDGWYKGRYFSLGPVAYGKYGTEQAALAELKIVYEDGTTEEILTDENWKCRKSPVIAADLYDGEILDESIEVDKAGNADSVKATPVKIVDLGYEKLQARRSLPVKTMLTVDPVKILHTPKGETVLDFGQNMAGWVRFYNRLPKGNKCRYVAGEILQDGCFYHENMRSAKTEFVYTSNGEEKWVRPHFTYYGFRYLLLEGFGEDVKKEDFRAEVLYSDMTQTGRIHTGNEKVNQLISNVVWGQRSNFLDVPTDCPQRDERLGWTGDAQIFSMTASYNMDTQAFFSKYIYDLNEEQKKMNGAVPFVVPQIGFQNQCSAAWGEAATVIPWTLYEMYGDKELLGTQYDGMKAWIDYISQRDRENGDNRLWDSDNHFGDWLSLDSKDGDPTGGTDMVLIATAFYYYSTILTARAAEVLGETTDYEKYQKLSDEIKAAYQKEFLTENGRLTERTQTAHVLTLYLKLYRKGQEQRLADELEELILENNGHLNTGFAGTTYLCPVLSEYGKNELAYQLLLNEEYPGWLYCVNLGATTIWERWNSVLPDGHMNPEGMNSLNHYAYGSILGWMYQYGAGIRPKEAGWNTFYLTPQPDQRLGELHCEYQSNSGKISSEWKYQEDGMIVYRFTVPFGTKAVLQLPGEEAVELEAGKYEYSRPVGVKKKGYNGYTDMDILRADEQAKGIIMKYAPGLMFIPPQFAQGTLKSVMCNAFSEYSRADYEKIVEGLKEL